MLGPLPPALVLAAGLGTRLRPLTNDRAKPAVPVAGRPLVVRILEWLAEQGVEDVVVNLHHRPETVTRVVGHGRGAGVRVRYSWEPIILGSAGGPRQALPLLGRRFFIVNGDTLTTLSLRALADTHERTGAAVTLAVAPHPEPNRYGGVLVADDGRVRGFAPAGSRPASHFVGLQVVEAAVFEHLPAARPAATIGGLYDELLAVRSEGRGAAIHAHRVDDQFLDIGTPADYLAASLTVARREGYRSLPVGAGSTVDPTASLTRTVVWDDAVVGAGCRLDECIVADGVTLPPGTTLQRRICLRASTGAREGEGTLGNAVIYSLDGRPAADR